MLNYQPVFFHRNMLQTCSNQMTQILKLSSPVTHWNVHHQPPKVSAHLKGCANAFDLASQAAHYAGDVWTIQEFYTFSSSFLRVELIKPKNSPPKEWQISMLQGENLLSFGSAEFQGQLGAGQVCTSFLLSMCNLRCKLERSVDLKKL